MVRWGLHQELVEEATLAGYQDFFFMFASLAMLCLVPVLLLRRGKTAVTAAVPGAPQQRRAVPQSLSIARSSVITSGNDRRLRRVARRISSLQATRRAHDIALDITPLNRNNGPPHTTPVGGRPRLE